MVKDYDCKILYHPGEANRVVDALSRKSSANLMSLQAVSQPLKKEIVDFGLELFLGQLVELTFAPTLSNEIRGKQDKRCKPSRDQVGD